MKYLNMFLNNYFYEQNVKYRKKKNIIYKKYNCILYRIDI